jgi:hypothetical protein
MHFTDLAIQIIADDKIRSAIKRGEFDRLPGLGRPLWIDACDDPDWWIRRKLRDEGNQSIVAASSRQFAQSALEKC